jgi:hypothetical protein
VLDAIAPLDVEIVSPECHAGDVLIFDDMFLHRTTIARPHVQPAPRNRMLVTTRCATPTGAPENRQLAL